MSASVVSNLFRRCPITGLNVHRDAENLVKVNAVVAIVALLVGAIAGHWVMGFNISNISIMGIVALSGVVVNDSLVLIGTYQHRMRRQADRWRFAFLRISVRYRARIEVGDVVEVRALERLIRFVEPDGAMPFWDLLRTKVELLPS